MQYRMYSMYARAVALYFSVERDPRMSMILQITERLWRLERFCPRMGRMASTRNKRPGTYAVEDLESRLLLSSCPLTYDNSLDAGNQGTYAAQLTTAKFATNVNLTSSLNPSVNGQVVNLVAVVSATDPAAGIPTGSVTFQVGGGESYTGALNAVGTIDFITPRLTIGSHNIVASYAGDGAFAASTSSPVMQVVNYATVFNDTFDSLDPIQWTQYADLAQSTNDNLATESVNVNRAVPGAVYIDGSCNRLAARISHYMPTGTADFAATFQITWNGDQPGSFAVGWVKSDAYSSSWEYSNDTAFMHWYADGSNQRVELQASQWAKGYVIGGNSDAPITNMSPGVTYTGVLKRQGNIVVTQIWSADMTTMYGEAARQLPDIRDYDYFVISSGEIPGPDSKATFTLDNLQLVVNDSANQRYVRQLYHDLFNRDADPGGLQDWTALLDSGTYTYKDVAQAITSSREYDGDVVDSFYVQYLGRHADAGGLNDWVNLMQGGYNAERIRAGILGAPEYYARTGGTSNSFVTALYSAFLNRTPDPGGLQDWTTILDTASDTRQNVATRISNSDENRTVIITGFYRTYMRRAPDPGGLADWKGLLANGISQPDIISVFLTVPEYFTANNIVTFNG